MNLARSLGSVGGLTLVSRILALVRSQVARLERQSKRRRRWAMLAAAVVALLIALPAIAVSRTLVEHWFGKPAQPGLRDYIGRVLHVLPGSSFTTGPVRLFVYAWR